MNTIITENLRKTVLNMKLNIKDMLYNKDNMDIKAYLQRWKASSNDIDQFYIVKEDGTIVSTSDDLYDKISFYSDESMDLRQLERKNIVNIYWLHTPISIMNNEGEEHYQLYVKIDHHYINEIMQNHMKLHMFYPALFFLFLAFFYIVYLKRMIFNPILILDEFLQGVITNIPKFGISEFNNLAKNLESNITKLETIAYYDALTGVYNRKGIGEQIEKNIIDCGNHNAGFGIALLDLDHFKKINDTSGHEIGDILLQEMIKAFTKELEGVATIGRLGGDEFLFLFNHKQIDELSYRLEHIIHRFQKPFKVKNKELYTEASIGVAIYPEDGDNASLLLKHADLAMYQAKQKSGNTYLFFSKELGHKIDKKLALEAEIKHGLQNNEFFLVYQPIIDTQSEKVVSVEALARWRHSEKGLIYPSDFISVIEEGCCVKNFGRWVIDTACAQQQEWLRKSIDITMSINLSVKYILSSNFCGELEEIVERYNTDLDKLKLEITEYALMEYKGTTSSLLKNMNKNGYHFILDDFGTGYSSITYLKNTPIEAVKIDKIFIDEINSDKQSAQMLDGILSLTKVIGLPSIAEGVEDAYQIEYLKNAGCDMMQGYYYSKPLEKKDFESYYAMNVKI